MYGYKPETVTEKRTGFTHHHKFLYDQPGSITEGSEFVPLSSSHSLCTMKKMEDTQERRLSDGTARTCGSVMDRIQTILMESETFW